MRREEVYLADLIEAADSIEFFLRNVERDAFLQDDLLRSPVLQKLTIIGEAAVRLPDEFHKRHPEIEWADIVGFRNIAVHSYFSIDWNIVWIAATRDAPTLREKIVKIIDGEYPSTDSQE